MHWHRSYKKEALKVDMHGGFCKSVATRLKAIRHALLLLMFGLVLAGCSSWNTLAHEDRLAQRAQARWDALVEGDFERAYEYETPGYRQVYSLQTFKNRFGHNVRWQNAKVRAVTPDGDVAEVRVLLSYKSLNLEGRLIEGERPVWERWLLVDGEWWYSER